MSAANRVASRDGRNDHVPASVPTGEKSRLSRCFLSLLIISFLLAFCVVVLGAYVRLSDAGLGCPDWPGCYGELFVTEETRVIAAQQAPATRPFNRSKAVKEMLHRYAAGILGLLVLLLTVLSWRLGNRERITCSFLLGLTVVQSLLGMWTVTELLKPLIVAAHLLGGMLILGLLYWLMLGQLSHKTIGVPRLDRLALVGLVIVAAQIFTGGWTSANYAALACPEFPACRDGLWWPETDFKEAFTVWREDRVDYEGGILEAPARTAIHLTHRLGAAPTFLFILSVALYAFRRKEPIIRLNAAVLLCVLCLQASLGIANVLLRLPLPVAMAHNSGAALLLLSLLTLYRYARVKRS